MSINHPSQFDPAKFGTLRVAFARGAEDFPSDHRAWVGLGVFACRALGPEFEWETNLALADILIQHWRDDDPESVRSPGRTTFSIGKPPLIEIDPARCLGERQFRKAVAHEIMSTFGCLHIKHDASEGTVDDAGASWSPVGMGIALMNQRMGYGPHPQLEFETFGENIEPVDPTALDIAEFNRVAPVRASRR